MWSVRGAQDLESEWVCVGWALVGLGQPFGLVLWINLAEVGPGVEPGGVAVVKGDFEGVVADHLGGFGGDGLGEVKPVREDGEGVGIHLFAEFSHFGAGGHLAEVRDGVEGFLAVGPVDGEALVFFEIEMLGGDF